MARFQLNLIAVAIFVVVCMLIPSLTLAKSANVRYCNEKADYVVRVSGVEITPFPVSRGRKTTFSIAASADKSISEGKIVIDVTYFGMHIHTETHDLCKETSCPVSGGDFVIAHSQVLPGYTPPGSYNLEMKMVDGKKQLTCITFDFSIGFVAPEEAVADS